MVFFNQLLKFLKQANTGNLKTASYDKTYENLKVKVSFGQANKAKTPWIAFLSDSQKVSNGIYPVFLYYQQYSLLILAYGISETVTPDLDWNLHNCVTIDDIIDTKRYNFRYGQSLVFSSYNLNPGQVNYGLDGEEIEKDLLEIISQYKTILKGGVIKQRRKENEPEIQEREEISLEGKKRVITSCIAERNKKLRDMAIKYHGVICKVCGFNFEEAYGIMGKEFIEIHHVHPLREYEVYIERLTDPKTDLTPICSNCHRMIHRTKKEVISIEKLRSILNDKYDHFKTKS